MAQWETTIYWVLVIVASLLLLMGNNLITRNVFFKLEDPKFRSFCLFHYYSLYYLCPGSWLLFLVGDENGEMGSIVYKFKKKDEPWKL